MKKEIIRKPIQARSIEKRKKILEAGMKMISEKGFYHTTTAEIAREAGVSTGIVYRYFEDKKDIFLTALSEEIEHMIENFNLQLKQISKQKELEEHLPEILRFFINFMKERLHTGTYRETLAFTIQDDGFIKMMKQMGSAFVAIVQETIVRIGYSEKYAKEKAFLIVTIVDHLCDDLILNADAQMDVDYIINQTAAMLNVLLNA